MLRCWPLSGNALDRTATDQDPRWVVGVQALADAGELAVACELDGDLDAAYMLGMFYWFRFEASGPQARQDDGTVAALFLIPVFTSDPGMVPEPLRRLYRQPGGPGGNTDHGAAAGRARALFAAYQGSGQVSLLWEAVTLFRAAVTATPAGHLDLAGYLSGLGGAMLKLAERTGDAGLLEQAVRVYRAAAGRRPGRSSRPCRRPGQSWRYAEKLGERTGDTAPLTEAVQTCQQAAGAAPSVILIYSQAHPRAVLQTYVGQCNGHRPPQSRQQRPPDQDEPVVTPLDAPVQRQKVLAGPYRVRSVTAL